MNDVKILESYCIQSQFYFNIFIAPCYLGIYISLEKFCKSPEVKVSIVFSAANKWRSVMQAHSIKASNVLVGVKKIGWINFLHYSSLSIVRGSDISCKTTHVRCICNFQKSTLNYSELKNFHYCFPIVKFRWNNKSSKL